MFLFSAAPNNVDLIIKTSTPQKAIIMATIFAILEFFSGHFLHSKELDLVKPGSHSEHNMPL